MAIQPRIPPPPPEVAAMTREITDAWQLDNILDALPERLNPNRAKDVMAWGINFITRLRDLARLTVGGHDGVVTVLNARVDQRSTEARPGGAQCTTITDIDHVIAQTAPLPVASAPQVNQNPPRRIALATGSRRSVRIADRVASESAPTADGRADGGNVALSAAGGALTTGRWKRRRDQDDDGSSANNDNVGI
jgi:hypothetical protein